MMLLNYNSVLKKTIVQKKINFRNGPVSFKVYQREVLNLDEGNYSFIHYCWVQH